MRTFKGFDQSEDSNALAIFVPRDLNQDIRVVSDDVSNNITKTALIFGAISGLALIIIYLSVKSTRRVFGKDGKKRGLENVLKDPKYYRQEY
jgi:hypothetical protein